MYILNNVSEIYEIANQGEFSVDLVNLSIRNRLRVIDFLAGLTFKSGRLFKENANIYRITL